MPFDPSLSSSVDRIRLAVGDVDTIEWLPDPTYLTLLSDAADDLLIAKIAAFDVVIAFHRRQPVRRTANGEAVDHSLLISDLLRRRDELKAELAAQDRPATPRFDLVGSSNVTTEAHW
jgi:hypothetical protein